MTDFKLHTKSVYQEFCSSMFAAYMNGEWGIEVGYKVPSMQISAMNLELTEWQLNSDCCALCAVSTSGQTFTISSYAVLSPNPCTPLVPLYAGASQCPCFVNQSLNNQATNCFPGGCGNQLIFNGTCCN